MDMDQYDRFLNFYREANEEIDNLLDKRQKTSSSNEHIIVMCDRQV